LRISAQNRSWSYFSWRQKKCSLRGAARSIEYNWVFDKVQMPGTSNRLFQSLSLVCDGLCQLLSPPCTEARKRRRPHATPATIYLNAAAFPLFWYGIYALVNQNTMIRILVM
jgi:hypothetical protein